jgi:two-component system cell cycle response regulator DivK
MREPILVVDDTPINRKLTERVLAVAGYDVRSAGDAEEALEMIRDFRPRLVLADIRLPGMDGLSLARQVKSDPVMRNTLILALTGCTTEEDQQQALDAGCEGYITKPIDTRTLPRTVQGYLDKQNGERAAAVADKAPDVSLSELSRDFLCEGAQKAQRLRNEAGAQLHEDARTAAHRWAGMGGTLGHPEITRLARRLEALLKKDGRAADDEVHEVLDKMLHLFFSKSAAAQPVSSALSLCLLQNLAGKKVQLVGFDDSDAARLASVLSQAQVEVHGETDDVCACELVILRMTPDTDAKPYFAQKTGKPLLLAGAGNVLPPVDLLLDLAAQDFIASGWTDQELIMRACIAMAKTAQAPAPVNRRAREGKTRVLIADDDPTTVALVKATLQNYDMECQVADEGGQALELIRSAAPHAVVLDVIMPNRDGFEVLASIKNDKSLADVRVILLTARQQEADIARGFGLGADDYVVKPFSPMELVARLQRVLREAR